MLLLNRNSRLDAGLYRKPCKDKIKYSTNDVDFKGYIGFARDTFRKNNDVPVLWEGTNGDYRFVNNNRVDKLNFPFILGVEFGDDLYKMAVDTPVQDKSQLNDLVFEFIDASILYFHCMKKSTGQAPPVPLEKKQLENIINHLRDSQL